LDFTHVSRNCARRLRGTVRRLRRDALDENVNHPAEGVQKQTDINRAIAGEIVAIGCAKLDFSHISILAGIPAVGR
jgi:hypothetical protein